MNKLRRRQLRAALDLLDEARSILETVQEDEQEAFDNMPESLQSSERGEAMEETISNLEDAVSSLEKIGETFEEVVNA